MTLENNEYTELLYEHGNYSYASWYTYRKYIEEIKKSYLKDLDVYHHENPDIDLSGINTSLRITHVWLNKLVTNSKNIISRYLFFLLSRKTMDHECLSAHSVDCLFQASASSCLVDTMQTQDYNHRYWSYNS